MTPGEPNSDMSERQAHAEATYERLFGPRDSSAPDNDPELMEILRRFIFGDVFDTGVLDDRIRELITVTVLACSQALPQLKSHTAAALNVGVRPIQIREAVYQLAPLVRWLWPVPVAAFVVSLKFAGMWLILLWRPLRLWLTPAAIRHRRVRARAITCFKVGAERRIDVDRARDAPSRTAPPP